MDDVLFECVDYMMLRLNHKLHLKLGRGASCRWHAVLVNPHGIPDGDVTSSFADSPDGAVASLDYHARVWIKERAKVAVDYVHLTQKFPTLDRTGKPVP